MTDTTLPPAQTAWRTALIAFGMAALLLLAADLLLLRLHPGIYRVPVGNYRDEFFLRDVNNFEESGGVTYRWTTVQSTLDLVPLAAGRSARLTLALGGRPEPATATLSLDERPWVQIPARTAPSQVTLLLPQTDAAHRIALAAPTFSAGSDGRGLGIKLEAFTLTLSRGGLPTWAQLLAQLLALGAVVLCGVRVGLRELGLGLSAALTALLLAAALVWQLPLASAYLPPLALALVLLAGLTWLLLPHAERVFGGLGGTREVRVLWGIMLLACTIRVLGMLYPTYDGQDLGRNVRRQLLTAVGQMYIMASSAEFGKGQTIYPTGPYLALMPGLLLFRDIGMWLELALTILEGSTALFVGLIAARLGAGRDGARIAALLFLASYASFSVHVYQFSAQIFGQWFTAPILLLLLLERQPRLRTWGLAVIMLMFAVYSHIGVAILAISWIGLTLLIATIKPDRTVWIAWGLFLGGVLLAAFFLYLNIIAGTLTHLGTVVGREGGETGLLPGNTPGLWKGLRLAYSDIGLLLLPFGVYLAAHRTRDLQALKAPAAMVGVVLFYFAVDLLSRLQVRYFFFALPLALALIALPLGRLAMRGGLWRIAAWLVALLIAIPNLALWLQAIYADGQISMTPLTH